jgi:multidrug efflux pump subunit AcrA (membrane-fusion protein)
MKYWKIGLLAVIIIALVGGAGYLGAQSIDEPESDAIAIPQTVEVTRGNVQQTVTAPGELVQTRQTVLGFDVTGKLKAIDLRPGNSVKAGQTLARLDATPFERALEEAQLRLSLTEAEYARQLADAEMAVQVAQLRLEQAQIDCTSQISQAEQALQTTRIRLVQAELQYPDLTNIEIPLDQARADEAYARDEYKKALDRPWEPQSMRDSALRAWNAAQDTLAIAEADYQVALSNRAAKDQDLALLALDVAQAQARLADLRGRSDPFPALDLHKAQKALADLQAGGIDPLLRLSAEKARADLDAATLIAHSDGVVLEVKVRVGEMVSAGMPLIVLASPGDVEVKASVIEEDAPLVASGQLVELFFDAAPDEMPFGVVARIVPQRIAGDRPLYPAYITPQGDLPDGLFPGMTVDASIIIEQRTDVLRLPRSLVRSRPDGTARVEVWTGQAIKVREITVGLRGDAYVEIVSGLQEGDRVIGQ